MHVARYRESDAFLLDAVAASKSAISVLYESEQLLRVKTSCTAMLDRPSFYFDATLITACPWSRWLTLMQTADMASPPLQSQLIGVLCQAGPEGRRAGRLLPLSFTPVMRRGGG